MMGREKMKVGREEEERREDRERERPNQEERKKREKGGERGGMKGGERGGMKGGGSGRCLTIPLNCFRDSIQPDGCHGDELIPKVPSEPTKR